MFEKMLMSLPDDLVIKSWLPLVLKKHLSYIVYLDSRLDDVVDRVVDGKLDDQYISEIRNVWTNTITKAGGYNKSDSDAKWGILCIVRAVKKYEDLAFWLITDSFNILKFEDQKEMFWRLVSILMNYVNGSPVNTIHYFHKTTDILKEHGYGDITSFFDKYI
jgi:hypothetical protein